ncbi:KE2 family protein [Trichomonas vaginalis G3]|uniref:KE2 family protein n=1 Tax=Trichomonas vaginalis (strain ATCC PRA-98 / G3) TaxID=412133 RepID=A2DUS1_TRIV3|nr:unfolded protein binding [Trichomonas vaginalis G3]EAY15806.1 KE2 family protein [Trichomonas vaginalis G3]KAI5525023.1 unfolded protein binding [Trichomonas vaginalis G3]|eukprot:XP_001328029.1 KE2 family protein [Trichomonas vaginalis G3]
MAQLEVSLEDQQRINKFGNLNSQVAAYKIELEALNDKKTKYETAKEDLELEMPDDVPYKIGTAFITLSCDDATEQLDADLAELQQRIDYVQNEIDVRDKEMKELRTVLYSKFGKENIGLEE